MAKAPPTPATATTSSQTPRLLHIAPAGDVPTVQHNGSSEEPHMPYTCVTCARRKVKCDKTGPPCGTCRKARQECQYQEPAPRKRKRKPVDDLQDRLDKYERLLRDNNILPKEEDASPAEPTPPVTNASIGIGMSRDAHSGKLIKAAGKTRYVDSNIWRGLGDDLHPSSDEEDVEYYGGYSERLMRESQRNHSAFIDTNTPGLVDPASAAFFSPAASVQNLFDIHPTYDLSIKLWKQFVQNVDPITRVLHRPTTLDMLQRASANPSTMTKVQECLLFAIYHFAVVATTKQECEKLFGQPKQLLHKRYHDAVRQCLVGCHFLRTTELAVLQSFILFLLASRDIFDPHTFWIMTGIAVRIAQRMGLHRDGESQGLNPFDVQMRRRVFWQLLPLDGLSGQLSGTGIAITADSWDTKQPLNVNDEDIWPGMETAPEVRKGATDMIFCLARSEIGKFHQKVKPGLGDWSKLWSGPDLPTIHKALKDLENIMEEQYIRYCDISNPVHCLTIAMARGAINGARLRIKLPKASTDKATRAQRQEMMELAIKVLDHVSAIHLNTVMGRYDWHMRQFFQWDPLIWMLNEVSREDSVMDAETAWARIESLYRFRPELTLQRRPLDVALNRLVLRSWDATVANRRVTFSEPTFVADLRSLLQERKSASSRPATETPKPKTNPFDPYQDASSDIPVYNYLNTNPLLVNNMLDDVNADVDWKFWEQLMQDSEMFPANC